MKKISLITILIVTLFGNVNTVEAQFFKKLLKHAKHAAAQTVDRKVSDKAARKTGKIMDTILDSDAKLKRNKQGIGNNPQVNNQNTNINNGNYNSALNNKAIVNSKRDFVAGTNAIFLDTFKNDAIGDFPVTWNTNSSAEVVTFNNDNTKWLQLDLGQYTPDGITKIPENCTFEFDLAVSDNFNPNYNSYGIRLNIIAVKDRRKDFMEWGHIYSGANGTCLRLTPGEANKLGATNVHTYLDGEDILDNTKNTDQFNLKDKKIVHVALWRQKTRLRVYLNGIKNWDLPRAFDNNVHYNSISFNTVVNEGAHFFISNLRLATAGKDMRHALLETGKFVTNDILFDVNKATIKPGSFKILDNLGKVLQDNPDVSIKIIGYTDSDGSTEANLILSKKRAQAIKEYLSNNFPIAGKRMQVVGKGESEPIASNTTPQGKAKNRRVAFVKINQ